MVRVLDVGGGAVVATCVRLMDDFESLLARACDGDDGVDDGVIVFGSIAAGFYVLLPDPFPAGYGWSPPQGASKAAFSGAVWSYQLQPEHTVTVSMVDEAGLVVLAACLEVNDDRLTGPFGDGTRCDGDDGTVDGVVHASRICRGLVCAWFVSSSSPFPNDRDPGPSVPLTFDATHHAEVTYTWRLPVDVAVVRVLDVGGGLFVGLCVRLIDQAGVLATQHVCDGDDRPRPTA